MLTTQQLDPWKQTSARFEWKYKAFRLRKCISKCRLQNVCKMSIIMSKPQCVDCRYAPLVEDAIWHIGSNWSMRVASMAIWLLRWEAGKPWGISRGQCNAAKGLLDSGVWFIVRIGNTKIFASSHYLNKCWQGLWVKRKHDNVYPSFAEIFWWNIIYFEHPFISQHW